MQLGTQIDGGEIKLCPKCGRLGLAIPDNGVPKIYYTHAQGIEFVNGSESFTGLDWCMIDLEPNTPPASA